MNEKHEKKRFWIEDNGIWDNGKKLTWRELRDVLNDLNTENEILKSDETIDSHILELKKENECLKFKLESTKELLKKVKDYCEDIETIINTENPSER